MLASSRPMSVSIALLTAPARLFAQSITGGECLEARLNFALNRIRIVVSASKAARVSGAIRTSILDCEVSCQLWEESEDKRINNNKIIRWVYTRS